MGAFGSLSQLLLKLTSPGVPDIYQGNETWDFSLVDPDNRRPVDYAARRTALQEIGALWIDEGAGACARRLMENMHDGRIKLYLTWRTLALRRGHDRLFREGGYTPVKAWGGHAEHVCAFARLHEKEVLLVIVPRLFAALIGEHGRYPVGEPVWSDTRLLLPGELAGRTWTNLLTGETVEEQRLNEETATAGEAVERSAIELATLFRTFPYALLRPHATGE